jgi:capsular polysaccharide export protein
MTQKLWIPPALRQGFPHLPAFFPDFIVLPEGTPCPDGAMIAGEGAAAFHEGPWSAPRFHDVKRAVGLVVPGLPAPPHTPDARLDTAQRAALPFSRFADPFRAKPTNLADALDILSMWRVIEAENRRIGAFLHMQAWKRDAIARMFGHDNGHAPFAETPAAALAQQHGAVLAWAARLMAETEWQAAVPIWRVEDGFIRSIGLGVNFAPAASLAIDPIGMHYDATRPSRLEGILAETAFSPELLTRAAALRATILRHNITKYNVPGAVTPLPPSPGRQRILVVGQVEDDASILFGAGRVRSNLGLLRAVREAAPDAFIIWKPHPDVQTGYRRGYLPARKAAQFADLVLQQGDIRPSLSDAACWKEKKRRTRCRIRRFLNGSWRSTDHLRTLSLLTPKTASSPSSSSMRRSWLYFAILSERLIEPVLIWPQFVATAMSAMVLSSVSPERWLMTAV